MRYKYVLYIILAFLFSNVDALGQGQLLLGQYNRLIQYYNPAAIGQNDMMNITFAHNRQHIGFDGAAVSYILMANMPIKISKLNAVAGMELSNESFGLFKTTELNATLAYLVEFEKWKLKLGSRLSFRNSVFDGKEVYIPDGIEGMSNADANLPSSEVNGKGMDFGLGLYIEAYNFYTSLSVRNVLNKNIVLSERFYSPMNRYYNLILGYNWYSFDKKYHIRPSVFSSIDANNLYRIDLGLDFTFFERFNLDLMYRPMRAYGVGIGAKFSNLSFSYRFELAGTNHFRTNSWGTHEIALSYDLKIFDDELDKRKYKSIRLL